MATPSAPYDFLGLVMTCNIYSADTGKWLSLSPQKGQATSHLPWFSSMSQKETLSGFGEVTINITPPTYEEALNFLSSSWLTIGNTMAVQWGYSRHASQIGPPKYYMLIKPDISFGDEFTISVRGTSFGWLTTQMQNSDKLIWNHVLDKGKTSVKSKKALQRATYRQVIELVAGRYGFILDWNGSPTYQKDKFSKDAQLILDSNEEMIAQGGLNDWQFLKHLAAKCCCRSVIVGGNVLRISDVREPKKADWILRFRGQMDLNNNVIPIDSFDSESTAMFLPRRSVASRFLAPNDPRLKLHPETKADESTSRAKTYSGNRVPASPSDKPAQKAQDGTSLPHDAPGSSPVPMVGRESFIKNKLQAVFDYNAETHGVKAKCSGPAIPSLLPEDLVKVEGVGDYFTAMYRVLEITWSLGESFAKQDIDLMPKGFNTGTIANWMSQRASSPWVDKIAKKALGPEKQPATTDKNYSWFRFMQGS